jgi:hypothetical protein
MDRIEKAYSIAKEIYAKLGVNTDQAITKLAKIPVSLHCWQGGEPTLMGLEFFHHLVEFQKKYYDSFLSRIELAYNSDPFTTLQPKGLLSANFIKIPIS